MTGSEARAKYEAFLAAIDNRIAGRDQNGSSLADLIGGSAEQNANAQVRCYKNLRRGDWSLALPGSGGKVVGHEASVEMIGVSFRVSEARRQAVIRLQVREIHAWAVGEMTASTPVAAGAVEITYNPYRCGSFTTRAGAPVARCERVWFTATGKVLAIGIEEG